MIIVYILFLSVSLVGMRFQSFNPQYLSREKTTAVKGIFVLMVFFSHFASYVDLSRNRADAAFRIVNSHIGQLMVVMFLFYSGYGIMIQILKNRQSYIDDFLRRRFFPTWLRFAICLVFFILLDCILGTIGDYSLLHVLAAFTGWTSIGNSNWFMFVYFALYLLLYGAFKLFSGRALEVPMAAFSAAAVLLVVILYICKESYWWNTLLALPFGMWFGYYRPGIEHFLHKSKNYYMTLTVLCLLFVALWYVRRRLPASYCIYSLVFATLVVMITMKVSIGNRVLTFFGNHIFSIYILQRIPMIVFRDRFSSIYLYFIVCFIITLLLAVGFDYAYDSIARTLRMKR